MGEHQPSEGEEIIAYFLDDHGIKYEKEVDIRDLQEDSKTYRIADFYLPKYKVYVEFLGKWNHQNLTYKNGYFEKMDVYEFNEIPCVYIYPNNLGILNDIFRMRLQEQLEKYPELKWQLFLFKLNKLSNLVFSFMTIWLIVILFLINLENIWNKHLVVGNLTSIAGLLLTLTLFAFFIYVAKILFSKKKQKQR